MHDLPDGVLTFLFTDIEGSTTLWEDSAEAMMAALVDHDRVIDEVLVRRRGVSVKPRGEGDSRFAVFRNAVDAVAAMADIQKAFSDLDWPTVRPIRVRAALHTGTADLQLGDYYGPVVNRTARLRAIAHGGQTVLSSATWELVRDQLPSGVSVTDMGHHTLKDLARPENVYQLDVEDLPDSFPPLASLDKITNNLPEQLTEFIGREAELDEVKRLLAETRLLTILAPGGTGKTRLAIQAAADVADRFGDGVFFANLADIMSSREIVQTIAEAIGISLSSDEDPQTQLLAYLANKRLLLILDNYEHVIEGAPLVWEILKAAPRVTVVVTSRTKLNLTMETVLTLGGLETSWTSTDNPLEVSGVRLFIDAAKRSNAAFSLQVDDLVPLASILDTTGGIPLAILLAAAWVDLLPVEEIASEVSKSLDFLESEAGDVPDRQRSVRAMFEYSWEQLGPRERETFASLSVFRGGFTRQAAEAVAGTSMRELSVLVNKSFVTASPERGRYQVHELLRQYGEIILDDDPERARTVKDLHASFYADLAQRAFELFDQAAQLQMVEMLEDDIENLRLGWRHLTETQNAVAAFKMLPAIQILYDIRGWFRSGVDMMDLALSAFASNSEDEKTRLVHAFSAAVESWFLAVLGRPDADKARAACQALRDSSELGAHWLGLQGLALTLSYLGLAEEMVEVTEEGMDVARRIDDEFRLAGLKTWRSLAAILEQDYETADLLLGEGFAVLDRHDDYYFMAWNLQLQATLATARNRPKEAISIHTRQVERCREIGYSRGRLVALEGLGKANLAAGDFTASRRAYIESIEAAERMGMSTDILSLMAKVGTVQGRMGDLESAVELLSTVLAEPTSSGRTLSDLEPIALLASQSMEEFRPQIDPDVFEAAHDRGALRPYETAFKELLAELS